VESWRVAQIIAERGAGIDSFRGSGYLVARGLVLTAAHVLTGAAAVRVRLDVGQPTEIEVQAERWWADPHGHHGTDLAVIMIPSDVTAGRNVDLARFGRISDGTAVLAVQALGLPRFKLRGSTVTTGKLEVFRDMDQVTGHAPVAANRRQGTLAIYLDDPPPAAPEHEGPSPWEGMSGAAVWASGRIIGVVAEHHSSEGTGRLTGRRIDRAYEQLPESDLDRLVNWLGLAPAAEQLPDVVPAGPGQFLQSAYLEQVRDIAPDTLVGRDTEFAQWAEFCAGAEAYAWWQAPPWSGKSALASWFVTHAPAGVNVVSFFITGRLSGQADGDAFLDAMIEQLNALGLASGPSAPTAGARLGRWLSLLTDAAAWVEERARRLVVVVDGLDEDEAGGSPPRGRPSIASLLPRRPPPGVRFIITSRTDPGLPDDVPSGHPLRTCVPRHLTVSWVAEDEERLAKQELRDLLAGDQVAIDVVGYIAGSGGGLSRSDLSALTAVPPHKLDSVMRGVFGRSLQTRVWAQQRGDEADAAARVYLFAHETLRVTAEEQLGCEVVRYRQGVHDWIRAYADRSWPEITPGYAVYGYPRVLAVTSDVLRLSALARDPCRHAFLLRATGSDYAALTEIRDAQRLIAAQKVPDLQAVVELAVYRHAISIRNQSIPVGLPAVWARLARIDHAEAVARAITDPRAQAQALAELVTAITEAGNLDRAEAVARAITAPETQVLALIQLAAAAAQTQHLDRASRLAADAEALTRTSTSSSAQARSLIQLAAVAAQTGDLDRAKALVCAITDPWDKAEGLTQLVTAIARSGDLDRAEAFARTIVVPYAQARVLAVLAAAAARAGDVDRASALAAEAEAAARAIIDPDGQPLALAELVTAITEAGDLDRAEAVARAIADPRAQARVLAVLAAAAGRAGDVDRASALAAEAEAAARAITNPRAQWQALAELVTAIAEAGALDRAEAVARAITAPETQMLALTQLATAAAQAGDLRRAEAIARAIADRGTQARALTALAAAAARAGDVDRSSALAAEAEAVASAITDPRAQVQALTALTAAAAQAGDLDRASALAADAEAVARAIADPRAQAQALAELVTAVAQAGDLDRAKAVARAITGRQAQAQALTVLAVAVAQAGDLDGAEALARAIADRRAQAQALAELVTAIAQAGDLDRAEAVARAFADPRDRARALAELAAAVAQAGDLDGAEALARAITSRRDRARALAALASAVAQAGDLDRAEALARAITDRRDRARALAELAVAVAQAGDLDRAEAVARAIADPRAQVRALAALAAVAVRAGDADRASRLAVNAEAVARAIADPRAQAQVLSALAAVTVHAGDPDRASRLVADTEALAGAITDPDTEARVLAGLASAVAQAGDLDRAEAVARVITDPDAQARALSQLATVAAQAGDADRARRLLALAVSSEARDIRSWSGTVSRLFPSVIRDAGDIFLSVYKSKVCPISLRGPRGAARTRTGRPLVRRGYGFAVADVAIVPCADAGVIAALHQATVAVAYREYFPDSPPPTVAGLRAIWAQRLADPTAVALAACRGGRPVGSVLARADPDFPGGQLVGLHVLPPEWGKGIGSDLHDAALAVLSQAGYHDAGLWVIAGNSRARRMYERRGWVRCPGAGQQAYGVIEVRYRRELP